MQNFYSYVEMHIEMKKKRGQGVTIFRKKQFFTWIGIYLRTIYALIIFK